MYKNELLGSISKIVGEPIDKLIRVIDSPTNAIQVVLLGQLYCLFTSPRLKLDTPASTSKVSHPQFAVHHFV